jgi:lipopolysaccharide biosynthesis regulator YciM
MVELLFLLLPLAFLSGWQASKKRKTKEQSDSRRISDNFVKGINYLLNEQPDKALEVFLTHPEIDEYTAETYLLLGNMFRNRGEVDRALRVHQNLIARPNMGKDQKAAAMLAYGEDFFAAGMLDRAEGVFQELLKNNESDAQACGTLRSIYEQLQDWDKAIEVAQCAQKHSGNDHSRLIAHYYCELAEQELENGNIHLVEGYIQKAKKIHKKSTRVMVLQGNLALRQNKSSAAFKKYQQVISSDPRLLGMLNQQLISSAQSAGGVEVLQTFLLKLLHKNKDANKDADILEYLLRLALEYGADENLEKSIEQELAEGSPSIQSVLGVIQLWQQNPDYAEDKHLSLLSGVLTQYLKEQPGFLCHHCGYKMHDYLWRCPACHHWDTIAHV